MRRARPLIAFLLLASLATAATAQTPARPPSDGDIRDAVTRRLLQRVLPDAGAIYVSVRDGAVTLRGTVASGWTKTQAFAETMKVPGVKTVISELVVSREWSDERIIEQIDQQLFRYVFYTIFDVVNASVRGGTVTLEGVVTEAYKAEEIANMIGRIAGVQSVTNLMRTVDASKSDDELRIAIATQLYRLPGFWPYSMLVAPPIHIAVERGRVTLFGTAESPSDRDQADAIVRALPGVQAFDNLIKVNKQ